MSPVARCSGALVLALGLGTPLACTPQVNVGADKPIVIQLDIDHEIRVKLDEDVASMLREERASTVQGRGGEALDPAARDQIALAREKQARRIGERPDGYVAPVATGPPAEVSALVARVNERRREAYGAIAAQRAVGTRAVEAVAGERRITEAEPGVAVMAPDGDWTTR